jgi:hypothetical protein
VPERLSFSPEHLLQIQDSTAVSARDVLHLIVSRRGQTVPPLNALAGKRSA